MSTRPRAIFPKAPPLEAGPSQSSLYCARCQAPATRTSQCCGACATPFTGAGSFDRVEGPPPSREFAFLFEREAQPAARLAARPYQAFC
jgi:predicted amidophosphoribosyltransferase